MKEPITKLELLGILDQAESELTKEFEYENLNFIFSNLSKRTCPSDDARAVLFPEPGAEKPAI